MWEKKSVEKSVVCKTNDSVTTANVSEIKKKGRFLRNTQTAYTISLKYVTSMQQKRSYLVFT